MIRNLLASAILLAASSTALAGDLADNLNAEGAVSADVVNAALANCADDADDACKADVLAEAIAAGIDVNSVMSLGLAAGMDANSVADALRKAGVSETDIVAAAIGNGLSPADVTSATAGGANRTSITVKIPPATVQLGTEPSSISPAG
jgi:lambda repressor-like predicted transcriptional regulator